MKKRNEIAEYTRNNPTVKYTKICEKFNISSALLIVITREYGIRRMKLYLTEKQKEEIINLKKENPSISIRKIEEQIGFCKKTTIGRILKKHEKIDHYGT